jgi:protein-S-isoprenylcysteine O-methyltransferase Ste14
LERRCPERTSAVRAKPAGRVPGKNPGALWVAGQLALFVAFALAPGNPIEWRSPGCALLALAAALFVAAVVAMGSTLSPFPAPVERGNLVTGGVFSLVRHPIYTAVVIGFAGLSLMTHSPWRAALTVAMMLFFDAKSRAEERMLRERYPGYADYAKRVKRFVPWIY